MIFLDLGVEHQEAEAWPSRMGVRGLQVLLADCGGFLSAEWSLGLHRFSSHRNPPLPDSDRSRLSSPGRRLYSHTGNHCGS